MSIATRRRRIKHGAPYPATTAGIRSAFKAIRTAVDEQGEYANRLIGAEAVSKLRSPRLSRVNVDTGSMREGYRFRVNSPTRIDIYNVAMSKKGFKYPILIEKKYGGAAKTLREHRTSIVRNTNRRLTQRQQDTLLHGELP